MLYNTNYNLMLQSRYWTTPTLPVLKNNKITREVDPCMREENLKKKPGGWGGEGGLWKVAWIHSSLTGYCFDSAAAKKIMSYVLMIARALQF
jgi:hypothetical protein